MRFVVFGLLVSGCASIHRQQLADQQVMAAPIRNQAGTTVGYGGSGPNGKFRCEYETETGSNYRKRVCRYTGDDWVSAEHRAETHNGSPSFDFRVWPIKPMAGPTGADPLSGQHQMQRRCTGSTYTGILPASILARSRMSLISDSRCWAAVRLRLT